MLWYGLWVYIYYIIYNLYIYIIILRSSIAQFPCVSWSCFHGFERIYQKHRLEAKERIVVQFTGHGHAKLRHRLHYAKTAIGEKCPITRPLETLSPECAEGETDTDGYTLCIVMSCLYTAKKWQNSRRRLTLRQTLYNRHSKIGKTRIARQVGAYRATNAWCSALVEHLQFGQLVGTNPSHFSLRNDAEIELKLNYESFIQTY